MFYRAYYKQMMEECLCHKLSFVLENKVYIDKPSAIVQLKNKIQIKSDELNVVTGLQVLDNSNAAMLVDMPLVNI